MKEPIKGKMPTETNTFNTVNNENIHIWLDKQIQTLQDQRNKGQVTMWTDDVILKMKFILKYIKK